MAKRKRIAILTGGGDCPGINAVIRGVAKKAYLLLHRLLFHGLRVPSPMMSCSAGAPRRSTLRMLSYPFMGV